MLIFSRRLQQARMTRNLTQSNMAQMLDVTLRSYQRYEAGDREPNFDALLKLADFFDVSVDYLLGRTDNPAINR